MKIRTLCTCVLLILILFTAFLIRIQGILHIPEGQFTCIDAYFYYRQAQIVSEHGHLPERDMHRWLPLGRDLGQTLNLYGYALAFTHKTVAWVFPNITVYFVPIYPTLNFAEAPVKIWEIRYPPEIQHHPKYLETGIPEIDTDLQP